ncbi:uncharacterized protein V6R79_018613 [Siganus canaliculatus]
MSCCHRDAPQGVRPGTERVRVTELSASGSINPTPATKPCEDSAMGPEIHISAEMLESLCGTRDLSHVTSLEICVNTQENTLGNIGSYLPRLVQLRLNNSMLMSVRDLGTTLSHLQVLWMSRCSLQELDGISILTSLKELYLAYNRVSDLSQIGMLENLQMLDLEGNNVDDLVQVQYLQLCSKLHRLTLEGNPVCVRPNPTAIQTTDYSYRAAVRELVPQLRYLDDLRVETDGRNCSSTVGEDWTILRNSIRDCSSSQTAAENADDALPYSRPASARRPASTQSCLCPLSLEDSRPHTGSRPMSATIPGVLFPPGSVDSDLAAAEAEASILTHGAGRIVFCGNPAKAVRARKERLKTAPTTSAFTSHDVHIHVPEHTYDLEDFDDRERSDVFAELRAWRKQHSRRLQDIEKERMPQVLAIQYSAEDREEDDDEEGFVGARTHSSDEVESSDDGLDTASPDSSLKSLSPDAALSPSPPLTASAVTGNRKLPGIRARRLRLSQTNSEHLHDLSTVRCSTGTGTTMGNTDWPHQRVQKVTGTDLAQLPLATHKPRPPPVCPLRERLLDSHTETDSSGLQSVNKHHQTTQVSAFVDRSTTRRPHTARAALQRHQLHHMLEPCRGSSHLD